MTSEEGDPSTSTAAATTSSPAQPAVVGQRAATLAEISRYHRARAQMLKEQNEAKYKTMCSSAGKASAALVDQTNHDVLQVFNAEQQIEAQIKELVTETELFQRKLHQWSMLFTRFDAALKEVGDLSNWSNMIEQDVQDTVTILDEVARKKREAMGLPE